MLISFPSSQERSAAWQIIWRCALFGLPLLAMAFIECFLLPIEAFSFRYWEALTVPATPVPWSGPFLPNQKLSRREEGDLAHGSRLAVPKDVMWETDARGFRNSQALRLEDVEVLVVGDSMIVGTSLTQSDRLTDRMSSELNKISYAYAPGQVPESLVDPDLQACHPKTVVFESIERSLPHLPDPDRPIKKRESGISPWLFLNRLIHPKFFGFFQAEWNRFRLGYPAQGIHYPGSSMVFFQGEKAILPTEPAKILEVVATVKEYQRRVEARGMKFVFLPIPNKETVYPDLLPSLTQSYYLQAVIEAARKQGIPTVDTFQAFQDARRAEPDRLLYHLDDTHWNRDGVGVVLNALAPAILSK